MNQFPSLISYLQVLRGADENIKQIFTHKFFFYSVTAQRKKLVHGKNNFLKKI